MNKRVGVRSRENTCGGSRGLLVQICIVKIIFGKKIKICSLAPYLGILDDEFEELLVADKISKVWYWCKILGLRVQTHRYSFIT